MWKELKNIDDIPKDCSVRLAVYNGDIYPTVEAASKSGGVYQAPEWLHGRQSAEDCLDGIRTAAGCLDANHGLVAVWRFIE